MIKPISIALMASLAAASVVALADDPDYSTSTRHMQPCMAKEGAKNDVRTDSDLTQYCTARYQKKHASNMKAAPEAPVPAPPAYPGDTTPNHTNQGPH